MKRWYSLALQIGILAFNTPVFADIAEERLASGSNIFVPTAFPLNPAANPTNLTLVSIVQESRNDHMSFIDNPGSNNSAQVDEKIAKKELALGGQYPLGGASLGLTYSEFRRSVSVDNENQRDQNHEVFVNRDYRMLFGVDFMPELRGAFTFHYTALKADLAGAFNIGETDRTHYNGSLSGYGVGLNYQFRGIAFGLFTHPPMRGKATVEGEQKIITEPGVYGFSADFKAAPRWTVSFKLDRWSYKHDERDQPSTSPINQSNILVRGLDLSQYYRKTMAYGLSGEYAVTPLVFVKGEYLRQEGVYLFDPDHLPGDDNDLETRVRYPEYHAGAGIKNRDFMAELGVLLSTSSAGTIQSKSGFGDLASYSNKSTSITAMLGASF
ncbi:MAG: hypothetical protein H7249_17240 [Chitinophagaceae bacterium]|nr:hypothetical protein [Oligoflexus sp.]